MVTLLLNQSRLLALLDTSADQARNTSALLVTYAQVDPPLPLLQMVLLVTCVLKENGVLQVSLPALNAPLENTILTEVLMKKLFAKFVPLEPNAPI